MNNQVDPNNQQPVEQQTQQVQQPTDFKNVQAVEIGRLRNEKIGKPGLVIWIFVLFAIVFISLPIIRKQLMDPSSFLYKIVYNTTDDPNTPVTPVDDPNKVEFVDAKELQVLTKETAMKYENLILKNFVEDEKTLTATIYSSNGILDLDSKDLYLEIYSNSKNLLGHIKLTGTFDYQEKEVELVGTKINYNQGATYYGKVKTMTDSEYPEAEYQTETNAEGQNVGSFTCKKDNSTLVYSFRNNSLISVSNSEKIELGEDEASYTHLLSEYKKKVDAFGEMYAKLDETMEGEFKGFVVNISVNYDDPNFKMPEIIKDYNYFDDTVVAKKVYYDMTGKGFECK